MATRYSGDVVVRIHWNDRTSQYDATVSAPGERPVRIHVGHSPASRLGVDSPEAYDSAAHAAISFADDEESGIGARAATRPDGSGWHISRTKANAWGQAKENPLTGGQWLGLGAAAAAIATLGYFVFRPKPAAAQPPPGTPAQNACRALADAVGRAAERCGMGTYDANVRAFLTALTGQAVSDCPANLVLRDPASLYRDCIPWFDSLDCAQLQQLVVTGFACGTNPGCLACRNQFRVPEPLRTATIVQARPDLLASHVVAAMAS